MAGITRVEFIAQQLRGMSPGVDWNVQGLDRSIELAKILDRNNILNLWELKFMQGSAIIHIPAHTVETESASIDVPAEDKVTQGYYFDYNGKRYGYLGTPTEPVVDPLFQMTERGLMIAWSAEGHGNVSYMIRPNKEKTALEIAPVWASSSDAGTARQWLTMIASFFLLTALPLAGVSVGNAIGSAVLPASFAAAYPGVTTLIGNVAVSAALSGGDVEKAVKNTLIGAAAGGVGDQAGGFITSVTDSEFIGQLASTATRTMITGGDIKTAVGMELLKLGANVDTSGFDFFSGNQTPTGSVFGDTFNYANPVSSNGWDFSIPDSGAWIPNVTGDQWDIAQQQPWYQNYTNFDTGNSGGAFDPSGFTGGGSSDFDPATWSPFAPAGQGAPVSGGSSVSSSAPPANVKPPPDSSSWNPIQVVQGLTSAAMSALTLIKAYRQLDQPSINTTARVVRPDGSVSVVSSNGMIQTRSPSGQIVSQKPPVGVPQSTLSGDLVVNNGNGTYTVVSPRGETATYNYASGQTSSESAISPTLLLGGGAVLLLLLMLR